MDDGFFFITTVASSASHASVITTPRYRGRAKRKASHNVRVPYIPAHSDASVESISAWSGNSRAAILSID